MGIFLPCAILHPKLKFKILWQNFYLLSMDQEVQKLKVENANLRQEVKGLLKQVAELQGAKLSTPQTLTAPTNRPIITCLMFN